MRKSTLAAVALSLLCAACAAARAAAPSCADIAGTVDTAVRPVLEKYRIPGMAVGLVAGSGTCVFNYGTANTATRKPVSDGTLFELGSVTKTFTATEAAYAEVRGYLSLSDTTAKYLPVLRGSRFGETTLLELGTHTPGGLALQVPDDVHDNDQLMQYFRRWRPTYAPGTHRTYNNPGIGTLGLITAISMHASFGSLVERQLLPALGMRHTYIQVPAAEVADYAEGYTNAGVPARMKPRVLFAEAYGIKSTAADMARFLQANMALIPLDRQLERAIAATHTGYFKAGVMTQDLIWEQYPYPVARQKLLQGNGYAMIFDATPVNRISPPEQPRQDVWINKTGSTDGFGAYIAFIPAKRLGIVILANKSYPIPARVSAAYQILTALAHMDSGRAQRDGTVRN